MKPSKITLALLLTFSPTFLLATEQQFAQLDEIQIVAGRDPSQWAKKANSVETISQDTLIRQQSGSVAESLKYLNNVDIQGGSRAIAQKPIIRGLGGNRVVQVIDGVRQNFDLEHRGSYFMPRSLIQDIQVIKGASSSLWGSGALGGMVAIRTPNALDLLKPNTNFGAKIHQGYQSANQLSETDVSLFTANDRFDALLSGFYNDANNLRLGKGVKQPESAYRQKGGLAKLGWQINDSNRLEFSHRLSVLNQIAPSNNELSEVFTLADLTSIIANCYRTPNANCNMTQVYAEMGSISYLTRQKITDQNSTLNYYFNPQGNPYVNSQITLYHNNTVEKESRVGSELNDKTELVTKGFNLKNSSNFSDIALTYGVDFYQDHGKTERGTNAEDPFRPASYNVKSQVTGAYLLAHLPLFEQKVVLSPSVRYDHYKTEDKLGNYSQSSHSRWSPAIALTWQPLKWFDLNARYTEAFRAPSIQERYASGAHFGTSMRGRNAVNQFIENPNLKPETAKNKELSANFHFDNLWLANDQLTLGLTYFQNDVKNLINLEVYSSNPRSLFPNISQYQNVANAKLNGFEFEAKYQTERAKLLASYAQTRGKDKDSHEALANIPAHKLGMAIYYDVVKDIFDLGARVTRYSAQKRVPSSQAFHYDGYTLTDLQASYRPMGKDSALRFDFAIENLFDKKYLPAFSLMEGSGRNVKASMNYTF